MNLENMIWYIGFY